MTWVYALQADTGPIKLGTTRDPQNRMKALQFHSPHVMTLLATTPGHIALENALKERWSAQRMWGEWFSPAPNVLADIKQLVSIGASAFISAEQMAADEQRVARSQAHTFKLFGRWHQAAMVTPLPVYHPARPRVPHGMALGPLVDPSLAMPAPGPLQGAG